MITYLTKKQMMIISFAFFISGCTKDEYFTQVYDKEMINKKFSCLKLELPPYSLSEQQLLSSLYNFTNTCENTLKVSYKSNISCNSTHNTNTSYHGYIQLELLHKDKLVYSVYKDLKNENMNDEIEKGYDKLCQIIKL